MFNRRQFLSHAGLGLGASALPLQPAWAQSKISGSDLRYIFVFAGGGWDPTQVFATEFDNGSVDMPVDGELAELGDLRFVDHADRPSVQYFMETYGHKALILNGVLVSSVAHGTCTKLSMTGTNNDTAPDWPAILGESQAGRYPLPHMAISGPSFPGTLGHAVTRTGGSGQLQDLLTGSILNHSDLPAAPPTDEAQRLLDSYMERRVLAAAESASTTMDLVYREAYANALLQGQDLKELTRVLTWSGGGSFSSQLDLAISALSMGLTRCATLSVGGRWDSHMDNDENQSPAWESLFNGLLDLMRRLEMHAGQTRSTLAEETVVVVMSEMGRTPQLNGNNGKDHWPYTSMMLLGPGIAGGRSIGGFDSYYYGDLLDYSSGERTNKGRDLATGNIGAALLELGDVDPGEWLGGVTSFKAALS